MINDELPIATLRIEVSTKSFGVIKIDLMKFKHPQIRNAINVQFEYGINSNTCSGAIISQENIEIEKLDSEKILNSDKIKRALINEVYR